DARRCTGRLHSEEGGAERSRARTAWFPIRHEPLLGGLLRRVCCRMREWSDARREGSKMTDRSDEVLDQPLWVPSAERVAKSAMSQFVGKASRRAARPLTSYAEVHRWSVDECGAFWELVWEHCDVVGDRAGPAFVDAEQMMDARFFPEARLNFTEN